ncbi:ORF1001 [White spot syndrome virus]|uniref:Wsv297 n=3 Tax=White spot syndrome virus TaxID=342409 RepID=Q8VAT9_WSSVS|nr:wsv297 [Shrimp white spot syndrome virus]AFX59674.1 wsv297 [White spot syndrome virus]AAL33299.1 wsv297 [Shrimp white spot syndrome virus]AAL89221.1 WSSV353 [Shrimp white spot syndrome virus]ATU84020.1 ORF1001 [White spot syndrome virus]AWQ60429.1 wsv297 [Shrimp white spot syndrome virus]
MYSFICIPKNILQFCGFFSTIYKIFNCSLDECCCNRFQKRSIFSLSLTSERDNISSNTTISISSSNHIC